MADVASRTPGCLFRWPAWWRHASRCLSATSIAASDRRMWLTTHLCD